MDETLPLYEAFFNKEKNAGVYSISLVKSPAMMGNFIALSEQKQVKFAVADKEQRILTGLVLEPNKLVYRNQGGKEFNITFSSDTIKELSHNFFRSGFQTNSTLEHDDNVKLEDITFVESWIIEDPKVDKAFKLGFEYPKGTWMVSMKVDNDKIWEEYIKTGKVLGFSIDGLLDLTEITIKKEIKMSTEIENKTIIEAITQLGKDVKSLFVKPEIKTEIKLGSMMSGDLMIYFDGEALVVNEPVWILSDDETKIPLPPATYEFEDGRKLVVTEEGVVGELMEAEGTTETEEVPMESEAPAAAPASEGVSDEAINAIKSLLIKYSEEADKKYDAKELVLLNKIEVLESEVLKFSDKPAATPIKVTPKSFGDMSNYEKMQFKKQNH